MLTCRLHGDFTQKPNIHLSQKSGCPICANIKRGNYSVSNVEKEWLDSIENKEGIKLIRQHVITTSIEKKFVVDGFYKETNTVYEFNGDYFHGNPEVFEKGKFNVFSNQTCGELYKRTLKKEQLLKDSGYTVVTIWENDYNKMRNNLSIK